MKIPTPTRQLLTVPYRLFRLQLQAVEQNVVARRWPDDAPARRRYEDLLAAIDRQAGELLDLEDARRRGEAGRRRQEALDLADELDAQAQRQRRDAEQRAEQELGAAHQRQREAARKGVQREADARATERAAKQDARERAAQQAEERKSSSDRRAKAAREAADRDRRAAKEAVDHQEAAAEATPRANLEEANERRDGARQGMADAERLGEAADEVAERRRS